MPKSATPRVPEHVREAVLDLRDRLARRFGERLERVRLFGSYARGDHGPESDVDVLVTVDDLTVAERREVFDIAEEVFFDRLVHVSPLALSCSEYRMLRDREYRIALDIESEGLSL